MSATACVPVPSISYSSASSDDTQTTSSSNIQLSCSQSKSTVTSRDSEILEVSQTNASVSNARQLKLLSFLKMNMKNYFKKPPISLTLKVTLKS